MFRYLAIPAAFLISVVALNEYDRWTSLRRPLTRGELQAFLRDRFDLAEVNLAGDDGRFTGSGRDGMGWTYQFDITQSPTERRVVATHQSDDGRQKGTYDVGTIYSDYSEQYLGLAGMYALWVLAGAAGRLLAGRSQSGQPAGAPL